MYKDKLLEFCDRQALTAGANSTNVIDLGTDRDVGAGKPLYVVVLVDVAADATNSDEVYLFTLTTDDAEAFPSETTILTQSIPRGTAAGTMYVLPLGYNNERFLRAKMSLSGTTPSITYSCWLTSEEPTKLFAYPNAI